MQQHACGPGLHPSGLSKQAPLTTHADAAPVECIRHVLRSKAGHQGRQQRRRGAGCLRQQQGHCRDCRCNYGQRQCCRWEAGVAAWRGLDRCTAVAAPAAPRVDGCSIGPLLVQLPRCLQGPAQQQWGWTLLGGGFGATRRDGGRRRRRRQTAGLAGAAMRTTSRTRRGELPAESALPSVSLRAAALWLGRLGCGAPAGCMLLKAR